MCAVHVVNATRNIVRRARAAQRFYTCGEERRFDEIFVRFQKIFVFIEKKKNNNKKREYERDEVNGNRNVR